MIFLKFKKIYNIIIKGTLPAEIGYACCTTMEKKKHRDAVNIVYILLNDKISSEKVCSKDLVYEKKL